MNNWEHALLTKKQMFMNALQYGCKAVKMHTLLFAKALLAISVAFLLPAYACMVVVMLTGSALYMNVFYQQELALSAPLIMLLGFGALLVAILIGTTAFAGILRFFFELHDRGYAQIKTLFTGFGYVLRFILFGILLGLLLGVVIGISLVLAELITMLGRAIQYDTSTLSLSVMIAFAVIVSLIVLMRLTYALYTIVDSQSTVLHAVRYSADLTKGFVLWLLLLHLMVYIPVNLLNMVLERVYSDNMPIILDVLIFQLLPLFVGLVAIVISLCARVRLYRLLQARRATMNVV